MCGSVPGILMDVMHNAGKEEVILVHDIPTSVVQMHVERLSKPNQEHKPRGILKVRGGQGAYEPFIAVLVCCYYYCCLIIY